MKTAIMIDTNSGISLEEGKQLGFEVVAMPVIVDDTEYTEYVDITHEQLYSEIMANKDVKTSQPSPGILTQKWDALLEAGYDEIVYIPMSSGLSSSYNTAQMMADDYDGKVEVVDNHRISVTLRDSIMEAKKLAESGKTAKEIKETLEEAGGDSFILLGVTSLNLFRKNGRITAATAAIANVLNLKPILVCRGEKFESIGNARGVRQCEKKILEAIKKELDERFPGVPMSNVRIGTAGTFLKEEDAERWKNLVQEAFPEVEVFYNPLSCSIACHTDVDARGVGVSVHRK